MNENSILIFLLFGGKNHWLGWGLNPQQANQGYVLEI